MGSSFFSFLSSLEGLSSALSFLSFFGLAMFKKPVRVQMCGCGCVGAWVHLVVPALHLFDFCSTSRHLLQKE